MEKKDFVLAILSSVKGAEYTPVQVQKLFFIIDKKVSTLVGGPYFNFTPYHYGPFDSEVYDILRQLEEDKDAETLCSTSNVRRYKLTVQGQEKGEIAINTLDKEASDYIKNLSNWIRNLSFAELVSSVYKAFPDMKVNSVFRG